MNSAESSHWLGQQLIATIEKVTLVSIKNFLIASSATAVGTLIYTNFMSPAQEADWGRAAFVGAFCGIIAALWPKIMSSSGKSAMNTKSTEVPCPDCDGQGQKVTFAIPKEDWESGLTGYALYSCNKINGVVACVNCGGHGAKYHAWYLLEQPELATSAADYRIGSGHIPFQRMPSKVS